MNNEINSDFIDQDVASMLVQSYRAFRKRAGNLMVVTDEAIIERLTILFRQHTILDHNANIRLANVFNVSHKNADFYLLQVEVDKGYSFSPKYGQRDRALNTIYGDMHKPGSRSVPFI